MGLRLAIMIQGWCRLREMMYISCSEECLTCVKCSVLILLFYALFCLIGRGRELSISDAGLFLRVKLGQVSFLSPSCSWQ